MRNLQNTLGILLGSTDLLESSQVMVFSIYVLSDALTKKEVLDLFLRKSKKFLCKNEMLSFVLLAIEEK